MSRSSELRTQRYKAKRQREEQLTQLDGDDGDDDYAALAGDFGQDDDNPSSSSTDKPVPTRASLTPPVAGTGEETFNLHVFLIEALWRTPYFKWCRRLTRFQDLMDEIDSRVTHVEPFNNNNTAAVGDRIASNAFCLLYRAMEMKLTKQQLGLLLSARSPVLTRAVGVLYVRYIGLFEDLHAWLEPCLSDTTATATAFRPYGGDVESETSLAAWARTVLGVRYRGTMLPRLPSDVEAALLHLCPPPALLASFVPAVGDVCEAVFEEDGQWYEARVDECLQDDDGAFFFLVTFLPDEEYGNQERVALHQVRRKRSSMVVPV